MLSLYFAWFVADAHIVWMVIYGKLCRYFNSINGKTDIIEILKNEELVRVMLCYRNSRILLAPWWRHEIKPFSALLALCEGNPLTEASDAKFWYFLWCAPEQTVEKTVALVVTWDAMMFMRHQCNEKFCNSVASCHEIWLIWRKHIRCNV